jgi:(R)-benzylsuccinyl-CoA dehydrogenase/naphthyl-2-methylsuccinyl-CoA dehydrogenase
MLENCQAGRESLLGEEGGALRLSADEAPHAWILMGARYVGMVERLLEMAAEHARDWVSLGAALAVRPAIQRMLAEMRVDADSVRWLVYHAAWQTDTHAGKAGKERPNTASIDRVQAAQVRLASGEMLKRAVDRVTMIYTGPSPSMPIEPQRLVQSAIPMEALELALEYARAVIAEPMLHSSQA